VRRSRPEMGCCATENKDNALGKGEWSVSSSILFADRIGPQAPTEDEDVFQNCFVRFGGTDKSFSPARNITTIAGRPVHSLITIPTTLSWPSLSSSCYNRGKLTAKFER
jgi:hypothetical protein